MKKPFVSLFYKFIVILVFISSVPLTFQGIKMINISSPVFKSTIKEEIHSRVASSLASDIDEFVASLNLNLDFAVAMELFPKITWEERTRFLVSTLKAHDNFILISMLDKEGMELNKVTNTNFSNESNIMASKADDEAFIESLKSGRPQLGQLYYQDNLPRVNIVYPLVRLKEYIFLSITLSELWKKIGDIKIGKTGFAYMVNGEGEVVYHPDIRRATDFEDVSHIDIVKELLAEKESGSMEFYDYPREDKSRMKKMVGAFRMVKSMKWGVVVLQTEAEAYGTLARMKSSAIFWILITVVISAVVAFFLGRSMTRPIIKLTDAVEKFGKGDMSQKVSIKTHDEMLTLGNTFNFMAEKIVESSKELVAREKMAALGQMASVVGHEIRNPLGVINNAIYFIKMKLGKTDPKIEKHMKIIEREVAVSNKIVTNLLGYSRTRAIKIQESNLSAIVKEAIYVVTVPDNVKVEENIKENMLALVDPDESREMFVNIIDNACQAMPEGGSVKVSVGESKVLKSDLEEAVKRGGSLPKLKEGDSMMMVTIADTGSGISKEDMSKILTPFFTTKQKGTGLGLAVVQRVLERYNGLIKIESEIGKGTKFIIKLPVKSAV